MTTIKCRYSIPYCSYHGRHQKLSHSEYWWCDDNSECFIGEYLPPQDAEVVNPQCIYCGYDVGEFEKTVKRYEYINGSLTVAGKTYFQNEIDYLEIDGRVLVACEETERMDG